jgi:uncharacterized membrane protein YdjX (TVP38/TMEM64 family)
VELGGSAEPSGGGGRALLRWLPLAGIVLVLALAYALGLHQYLSRAALREHQVDLLAFVAKYPLRAALAYVAVYVAVVAVSFPGSGVLTITGGFLFGAALGTALASIGCAVGATIIFLVARTSIGALMAERAGPRVERLRRGFRENGFWYLLFVRLVPLFPFWLVNLAAALFGMRLLPYVAATAIGVVPPTLVFAYFGQGLGSALESDGPHVPVESIAALVCLAGLALLPALLRRRRRGKDGAGV